MSRAKPHRAPAGRALSAASGPSRAFAADTAVRRGSAWPLIAVLAALAVARAVLTFTPGMWAWGLNVQRFAPPALAWATWLGLALALIPPVADALASAAAPVGEAAARRPGRAALVAGVAVAVLLLALPDRAWFLGDFQFRARAIQQGLFDAVLPQTLPLDRLLHSTLPRWLHARGGLDFNLYARLLGAIEGGLVAGLAVAFVRLLRPPAAAFPWLVATVATGGFLAVFTGFAKSTGDQCVVTLALAVLGMRMIRGDAVHAWFGAVLALAMLDHRSTLVLFPVAAIAWGGAFARREPLHRIALAALPPLLVLAALVPRLEEIVRTYDMPMHVRTGSGTETPWAGADGRIVSLVNAFLLLVPTAALLPALLARARPAASRTAETLYLFALVACQVSVSLVFQPRQGMFRDWEVQAPAALALSLLVAWGVSRLPEARMPRVAVAAGCATLLPTLLLLAVHGSTTAGLARARAFVVEPPRRTTVEQTFLWDYLGERHFALGRFAEAAEAIRHVAAVMPEPSMITSLALAETRAGEHAAAATDFRRVLAARPGDIVAWAGLGAAAERLGDTLSVRQARQRIAEIGRDPRALASLRKLFVENPGLWPEAEASLRP